MDRENYYFPGFVSILIHVVLIGGAVFWAVIGGCAFKDKSPEIVPFTVAIEPVGDPDISDPEPQKKEPEVKEEPRKDDIPAVVPEKKPEVKPKPKPPEKKPEVKPKPKPKPPEKKPETKPKPKPQMEKGKRINNVPKTTKFEGKQVLTPKQLADALKNGAVVGSTTSIPADELSRNISILKREITKAWLRPSRENAGRLPAVIRFSLWEGGRVSSPVLVSSSGSKVFDDSAIAAVRSVGRVDNLSYRFIKENSVIELEFSFDD